jgi:hypothetical protein
MATENQHFDENIDLEAGQNLATDLKALFDPQGSVPPQVDRAILDAANKRFVRRGRCLVVRWAASAAAAAAVIILLFALNTSDERASTQTAEKFGATKIRSVAADAHLKKAAAGADIDLDGRVDILDAFKLARYIKSAAHPDKKWDMNGDGLVNRKDVDLVAFAAVRLDKGVL